MVKIKHDAKLRIGWILFLPLLSGYLLTEAPRLLMSILGLFLWSLDFLTDKTVELIFPDLTNRQVTFYQDPDRVLTIGRWRRGLATVLQQCGEVVVEGVYLTTSFPCY